MRRRGWRLKVSLHQGGVVSHVKSDYTCTITKHTPQSPYTRQMHLDFQWLLSLLLKTAAQVQVGKTKLFINCFRNPTSTCATENWRKNYSWKQPTVDCMLEHIQRSGIKQCREGHNRTWTGMNDLTKFDVLHLDTSNSYRWAATAALRYVEL